MTLLVMAAFTAHAAPVDVTTARGLVERFVQRPRLGSRLSLGQGVLLRYVAPSAVKPSCACYYVFDVDGGSAFVIIAGDDRAGDVLAYGNGSIDMAALPCNLQWWLGRYRDQVEYLHAHPGLESASVRDSIPVVEPLLTCRWDQTRPFNNDCPVLGGVHCVTGCVATAMAQMMYRWRFPAQAPALPAYVTDKNKIQLPALPAVPLCWDDMLDTYITGRYNDAQAAAVATLMRYCGQSCEMDYGTSSGALTVNQLRGVKLFGYNPAAVNLVRYNYDDAAWEELMAEELLAARPILYDGKSTAGVSHAFVIDGSDGWRYHVNWGWGGTADGYFALDAFVMGFNERQSMLYHVFPDGDVSQQAHDLEHDGIYYRATSAGLCVERAPGGYRGHVVIPASAPYHGESLPITAIAPGAFAGNDGLTGLTVGAAVSEVGEYAFEGCTALRRVSLPASLSLVRHGAFNDCTALDTVAVASLETWCAIQFRDNTASPMYYASHLFIDGVEPVHLVLPDGVTQVHDNLFRNCSSLLSVTLPNSVTGIGDYAFYRCSSLETVIMGNAVTSIGYCAFARCKALTSVEMSPVLKVLGRLAFKDCEHLACVTVPESVNLIPSQAFYRCKRLSVVTLGSGVDSVATSAFAGCTMLDTVCCKAVVPPSIARKNCFDTSSYSRAVLCVPPLSLGDYASAPFWELFVNLVPIATAAGIADVNGDGEVTVADVNALIGMVLEGDPAQVAAADVNGDGELGIADVNAVIDCILGI